MNRRTFLKTLPVGAATVAGGALVWRRHSCCAPAPMAGASTSRVEPMRDEGSTWSHVTPDVRPPANVLPEGLETPAREAAAVETPAPTPTDDLTLPAEANPIKATHFDRAYEDDVQVAAEEWQLLLSTAQRLQRAQRVIGHGHFNIIGFDALVAHARQFGGIGRFPAEELALMERLFFADARRYGFFGERVTHDINHVFARRDVEKIRGTGHYLLHGPSRVKYDQLRRDLGDSVVLTSGVRGVVKQFQLFLGKAIETEGNLSQASRSLAPPGYSYHAAGDFDVGKVGFGLDNFTEAFATTDEYRRMIELGYIDIRYTERNPFGVRHEPWHVKIA